MRARLGLALLLAALALLAWCFVRVQEPGKALPPQAQPADRAAPGVQLSDAGREGATTEPRQANSGEARFEPLPGDTTELVVRFVTGNPEAEVRGVQAWALEMDGWGEYRERFDDVEAELRLRGRALVCDEQGRVHVPLPSKWVLVGARSGELFGAQSCEAADAPQVDIELVPSHGCRVRTRSVAGGPVAGVSITLAEWHGVIWRSRTDAAGELVIPNLEWLLADDGHLECAWFVATEDVAAEPPTRRFEAGAANPREIEFAMQPASTLRISVQAADGTPLAVHGQLDFYRCGAEARRADLRLGHRSRPSIELHGGSLLVPRVAPGAWFEAYANFDGGGSACAEVRMPDALGAIEIPLRLAPEEQALFVRVLDEDGAPLCNHTLQWQSFEQEAGKQEFLDLESSELHTDESGRGVLVVPREDLLSRSEDPDEEPEPVRLRRGRLRLEQQGTPFESQLLRFEELGSGCVCDLGDLRLAPAPLIVAGRVHDESGRPLARALVELTSVSFEDGEEDFDDLPDVSPARTGADGRFAIRGACPGGTVRVYTSREGYASPTDAYFIDFECGAAPELDITLIRTGSLRMSVIADGALPDLLDWSLEGADHEEGERLFRGQGPGEIVREAELLPGLYRVRLRPEDPDAQPIVDVAEVLVRPGEMTLDPRLQDVALHIPPSGRPSRPEAKPPIALKFVDEWGGPIADGVWISWGSCSHSSNEFHGGVGRVPADLVGRQIGVWAPGCRFLELACPERDAEVALRPALRARVHLDPPSELRGAGVRLFVGLHGAGLEYLDRRLWWLELDAHGEALFECPGSGRYTVHLSGVRVAESGAVGEYRELELDEWPGFDVVDQAGEQRFALAITAESWTGLVRALGLAR